MMTQFRKWSDLNVTGIKKETRSKYVRYGDKILAHFDQSQTGFDSEALMSNSPPHLPGIEYFLVTVPSPAMKSVYVNAYQYLIKF